MKKVLLALTTLGVEWQTRLEEANRLNIKEIALFPTVLEKPERQILYQKLEESTIKSIPFVHTRDDMELDEYIYFQEKFGTVIFNAHGCKSLLGFLNNNEGIRKDLYIENNTKLKEGFFECLELSAGLCLDVSHLEDTRLCGSEIYRIISDLLKKYKVGCAHISGMRKKPITSKNIKKYSRHDAIGLSEFNYVKEYLELLPNIISIELNNTFAFQKKVKDYLESIINK